MISTPTDKETINARIANFLEVPKEDDGHLYELGDGHHGFGRANPLPRASFFFPSIDFCFLRQTLTWFLLPRTFEGLASNPPLPTRAMLRHPDHASSYAGAGGSEAESNGGAGKAAS